MPKPTNLNGAGGNVDGGVDDGHSGLVNVEAAKELKKVSPCPCNGRRGVMLRGGWLGNVGVRGDGGGGQGGWGVRQRGGKRELGKRVQDLRQGIYCLGVLASVWARKEGSSVV